MTYKYIRDDNGEVVEVDFLTAINQSTGGFITLEDGTTARRLHEQQSRPAPDGPRNREPELVSDSLGFPAQQLGTFEADRIEHGFNGVEFKPDKDVPGFMRVHFSSKGQWERYVKHRGLCDMNGSNGGRSVFSEAQLERAGEILSRQR